MTKRQTRWTQTRYKIRTDMTPTQIYKTATQEKTIREEECSG